MADGAALVWMGIGGEEDDGRWTCTCDHVLSRDCYAVFPALLANPGILGDMRRSDCVMKLVPGIRRWSGG